MSDAAVQKFDVGGTVYMVSKSLLEQHPDTMLCRIASEIWQKEDEDHNKPIFVERNGQRFQYVLDYMRDGKVILPHSQAIVSKPSLLEELTYFGFQEVNPETIQIDIPFNSISNTVAQMTEEFKAEQAGLTQQRDQLTLDIADMAIAHACAVRTLSDGEGILNFCIAEGLTNDSAKSVTGIQSQNARSLLDYQVVNAVRNSWKERQVYCPLHNLNKFLAKYSLVAQAFRMYYKNLPGRVKDSREVDGVEIMIQSITEEE